MNEIDIASFLSSLDPVSYADIIDALTRGEGNTEYFSPDSGIVYHHKDGVHYIACTGPDKASFIRHIPSRCLASVHGEWESGYMMDSLGYERVEPTYLFSYGGEPFGKSENVHPLDLSYLDFVISRYNTSSEEDIRAAMETGHLYGAFSGDSLMGFAGFHMEGSMGMLLVLPEYRRRGVGEILEKHLITTAIEEGRKPFCNVFVSNSASIAMQEKLGLERGGILSWWTWKD